jgi:hypothetical protein
MPSEVGRQPEHGARMDAVGIAEDMAVRVEDRLESGADIKRCLGGGDAGQRISGLHGVEEVAAEAGDDGGAEEHRHGRANRYIVLAASDENGLPWASPVLFATEDFHAYCWCPVRLPATRPIWRHARNWVPPSSTPGKRPAQAWVSTSPRSVRPFPSTTSSTDSRSSQASPNEEEHPHGRVPTSLDGPASAVAGHRARAFVLSARDERIRVP